MLVLRTPAKVNLFLEIEGKRKDGYHNLTTLFLKVNLFDKLSFCRQSRGIALSCKNGRVPTDHTNLVYKAAQLMQQEGDTQQGVRIRIEKNIPVGAGLGGGSSDAACAFIGLNRLWNLKLSSQVLFRLGRRLGADVPLFLNPETAALGRGRGDRLSPVFVDRRLWIVLVIPDICVSTQEIYAALPRNLTKTRFDVKLLCQALRNTEDIETIGKTLFNRLESVTFRRYEYLAQIKKMISALGVGAVLMSGSGSVIYGVVKNRKEAMYVKNKLQGMHKVMVVRSL